MARDEGTVSRESGREVKYVTDTFDVSWPEDEHPNVETWNCIKCNRNFVDPEDHSYADALAEARKHEVVERLEPRLYWLSVTEPLCGDCASEAGIPPID